MSKPRQIVLFGPPFSGKRTFIQALAQANGASVDKATHLCAADAHPYVLVTSRVTRLDVELVTVAGSPWSFDAWWPSISNAAAIALMLDSQALGEKGDKDHVAALASAPRCPPIGCVVWTKDDLVTTHGLDRANVSIPDLVRGGVWRDASLEQRNSAIIGTWPTFSTRVDNPDSMRAPIDYLISHL